MSYLRGDDYPGAAGAQSAAWNQRPPQDDFPDEAAWAEDGQPAYADGDGYYQDEDPYAYYPDSGDGFAAEPATDAYLWQGNPGSGADDEFPGEQPDDYPPPPFQQPGTADRGRVRPPRPRYQGGRRRRQPVTRPQRVAGIVVAAASVVGVALFAPKILTAAENETLTGVVSQSSLDRLNFGTAGRVGRIRVRLGQVVRKGQVLAREVTPAGALSALHADRAAIVADKADLAALTAAAAPSASLAAARAQLATDRAKRAADEVAMEIVAPHSGTVVAIFGQAGGMDTPAGLARAAGQPASTLLSALTLAGLRAGGRELPLLALRTASSVQVRVVIPTETPAAVRIGYPVTISVPAAQLSHVSGVITELSARPDSAGGGEQAVVQLRGSTPAPPLTGMTADVHLGA
jgi:multidrug efflux pump subunit AcrA (membrane-fusion protein)